MRRPRSEFCRAFAIALAISSTAVGSNGDTNVASESAMESCDAQSIATSSPSASCSSLTPSVAERKYLTGDWFGYRSAMQDRGVTFSGNSTHLAFGVEGGIERLPPIPLPLELGDTFEYTGRGEYDLKFDLEKFGGLPYGSLLVRAEHWYGEYGNVSLNTGALPPAVFPALLPTAPNDQGELFLTNFVFTQPLSESFVLYGGKKDVLGAADQDEFAGGDGTEQFVNQAFIANPAFLLGLPYSGFVVGAAMPQSWGMVNVFAYDPKDRTKDFFDIDDLYANGVILGTEVKANTETLGRPGDVHVGGMWKKVDLTDLQFNEPPPGVFPQPVVPGFQTRSDSWTLYSGFDHYLKQFEAGERKGWGIFGRASISDGNPTPLRYFLSAGLGGDSNLRTGRRDKWGVGWYYVGSSTEFGPLPRQLFGPRDGTGVEMFYNFQVRPWMNITPDVQYIKPDAGALADEAFVYGLRMNMIL